MSADHSEWVAYQLGDVGKILTGKTPPGTEDKYFNGKTLFVTPTDMGNHREITETQRTLSTEGENVLYRVVFERGIVVSCIGWQMGKSAIINKKSATNQQINTVLPDEGKIDFDFLYYVLSSKRKEIFDLGATCTRTPILKKSAFEKITFKAPGINEQRAIAGILSSFDNKIELNRQINQTLEEMAQAIFKSWFVDFEPVKAKTRAKANGQDSERAAMCAISGKTDSELDNLSPDQLDRLRTTAALFPDELTDSELGLIPKGWRVKRIKDVAAIIKGKSYKSSELKPSKTSLVTLKSFNRGGGYRLDGLKEYTGTYKQEQEVVAGDLIIAYTDVTQAADVIGKPAMVIGDPHYEHLVISLDVAVIRPDCDELKNYLYGLAKTYHFQEHTKSHTTGTTVLHLGKDAVPGYRAVFPGEPLVKKYFDMTSPLFLSINERIEESRKLSQLRDTLLPKLLSGEIDLSQVP